MHRSAFVIAALVAAPALAHADDFTNDPESPSFTRAHQGASEVDIGALGVLTHESFNNTSTTQVAMTFSGRYQYFVRDALSVGAEALYDYTRAVDTTTTTAYGFSALATGHLRLGRGAFLRPTIALGALFGSSNTPTGLAGLTIEDSSTAFLVRLQLPFAYYTTSHLTLQAGPELDILLGSSSPQGGGNSTSFTEVVGGFSVAVGYTF